MNTNRKSILLTVLTVFGFLLVPYLLVLLRDFLYVIILISTCVCCLYIVCLGLYEEIRQNLMAKELEEEEIYHRFNGDPRMIRFYKGFLKYFEGDLNAEQLERYFTTHKLANK